ncbi:helix-turn-helix transcriptional regulator [Saxibacter everestensis]|uniref:Helix-turn-helix transcriptional regulator n=1 Tax=Saxibacter everestensis TaxID=2909229 RepID=A0ABY8QXB6_9MICO|nr:helix-turn-helix transcriptional regulator [Brevibacteriaceae bacterium ZFBP1038]
MSTSDVTDFEAAMVASWSDIHKKSALMQFILLVLHEKPCWSAEIRDGISALSEGSLHVDEQSLHRALRRLAGNNLITFTSGPAPGTGARRKTYQLTQTGERVLRHYLQTTLSYARSSRYLEALAAVVE